MVKVKINFKIRARLKDTVRVGLWLYLGLG